MHVCIMHFEAETIFHSKLNKIQVKFSFSVAWNRWLKKCSLLICRQPKQILHFKVEVLRRGAQQQRLALLFQLGPSSSSKSQPRTQDFPPAVRSRSRPAGPTRLERPKQPYQTVLAATGQRRWKKPENESRQFRVWPESRVAGFYFQSVDNEAESSDGGRENFRQRQSQTRSLLCRRHGQ
jgi:hypothetical protein